MGLDQYLYAKRYYSDYDFNKSEEREKFAELQKVWGEAIPRQTCGAAGMSFEIVHTVAYWRKANAIHGWFVRHCGQGIDDCRPIYVSREMLTILKTVCEEALASRDEKFAKRELPPTEGFFFGTYEMDDWYWSDMQSTVDQLNVALSLENVDEYTYQASW